MPERSKEGGTATVTKEEMAEAWARASETEGCTEETLLRELNKVLTKRGQPSSTGLMEEAQHACGPLGVTYEAAREVVRVIERLVDAMGEKVIGEQWTPQLADSLQLWGEDMCAGLWWCPHLRLVFLHNKHTHEVTVTVAPKTALGRELCLLYDGVAG